ncbi:MAG TPA: DUF5818 domain-containing protein [Terriglobia bacterium]|nr:DUF5818 domain-containing protein [Terriglobia bacterium]
MNKVNLLVVFVALGVVAWMIPVQPAQATTLGSAIASQQDEPAAGETEHQSTQTFMGKIMQHEGKYVLQGEGDKTYQLDDQEKARQYDGKNVKVSGTLDKESSTIHVTSIEAAEG